MSISRRRFISMLAGTGAVAATTTLTGCRPVSDPSGQGWLPNQYRDQSTFKPPVRGRVAFSPDDPALVRDDEKCILCGQCIEIGETDIGVVSRMARIDQKIHGESTGNFCHFAANATEPDDAKRFSGQFGHREHKRGKGGAFFPTTVVHEFAVLCDVVCRVED